MTRYFLHLKDGHDEILDPDGEEHASMETLRRSMLASARDIIGADVRKGIINLSYRIEAHDPAGHVVLTLPFAEAITIVGG